MLATDLCTMFTDTGIVRVNGAFDPTAMRDAIWRYASARGVRVEDRATWPVGGHGAFSWKGLNKRPVFAPLVDNPHVVAALDAIFGEGGWTRPRPGAQILVTFPTPEPWVLPAGWHMDTGFERASFPVHAVKLFAFFGDVAPRGGGTMALSGTHRLVDRYRETIPAATGSGFVNWRPFMRAYPPLAELLRGDQMPDRGRSLVGEVLECDGVPVEVVEMTGAPGDVVITHLHVFHAGSPNVSDVPRQMLGRLVTAAPEVV